MLDANLTRRVILVIQCLVFLQEEIDMTMAKEVYSTESIGETVSEAAADIAANALSAEC